MSQTLTSIQALENGNHFDNVTFSKGEDEGPKVTFRNNSFYIVSALLFQEDKVLLVSEAKHDGKWYLPAGKVKYQESLKNAFKRELLEESSYKGEPDHLLSINAGPGGWFRFNFIGHQTGGHLKTPAEADKDTLEARWFPCSEIFNGDLNYRAQDMFEVIKDGILWNQQNGALQREKSLVLENSFNSFCLRPLAFDLNGANVQLAIHHETGKVPLIRMGLYYQKAVTDFFQKSGIQVQVLGILAVEHSPREDSWDGYCLNVICKLDRENSTGMSNFKWIHLDSNLSSAINKIIGTQSYVWAFK